MGGRSTVTAGFAAKIAPEIDRIRVAIAQGAMRRLGPLVSELGVSPGAGPLLSMFRNLPPGRRTNREAVDALFPYQPAETTAHALAELESAGVVAVADDEIRLTEKGVAVIDRLYAALVQVVDEMWRGVDADFEHLASITAKAITAAASTGGPTFHMLSPVYERAGTPASVRLAESLTPLRFHRFDAHVAAWRDAGLTPAEVQALENSPAKEAIEADTNARAAAAYETLDAKERTTLLDGLRVLPVD